MATAPTSPPESPPLLSIAVIIPCLDEEQTVGKVVRSFRRHLPRARIYVYDNGSTDRTAERARSEGAIVRTETRRGKGWTVRRAFCDIEADAYILVDGDATYEAAAAPRMIETLVSGPFDFVNGARRHEAAAAYPPGHAFGNAALTGAVTLLFGRGTDDMLSGYKALSRRFVKSFPSISRGFEIETELMVHALELGLPVSEMPTAYAERPPGSASKLSTVRDGCRIGWTIQRLVRAERPLAYFAGLAALASLAALILFAPVLSDYLATGLVDRMPTLVMSGLLGLAAAFLVCTGLVLDLVQKGRTEAKKLAYLCLPPTDVGRPARDGIERDPPSWVATA